MREGIKRKIFLGVSIFLVFLLAGVLIFSLYKKNEKLFKAREEKILEVVRIINQEGKVSGDRFQFGSFTKFYDFNFFKKIKEELVKRKLDFVLVDLSSKKLFFYQKGKLTKEISVPSIGKEGSFWETPVGFYQVEAKIKNAFSSIGKVYMPYSLQFQGNFFIHGWPYYPDGRPVSSSFSGGCIRLKTEDAKYLFSKLKIGTPILVIQSQFFKDNSSYRLRLPQVSAKAYLVADLKNNFVFVEKNPSSTYPIASITKLVTALVGAEYINLWRKITIEKQDLIYTSKPRLKVGERWSGFDLLYPLLMESSNEAALAFSRFLGREEFVSLLNKKAKSIGMEESNFVDPYGGSSLNKASLRDLFALAKYLYFNRRFILDISKGKIYSYLLDRKFDDLKNFNCYFWENDFVGGKVGNTSAAKETMLAIFTLKMGKELRPIGIIALGSNDVCKDVGILKEWVLERFELKKLSGE